MLSHYTILGLVVTYLSFGESCFPFSPYQSSPASTRLIHSSNTVECLATLMITLFCAKYRNDTFESLELRIWHWNADWNVVPGFSTDPL